MQAYAEREGVAVNMLRFLFDGKRINVDATVASLDLEEGDMIEVYEEMVGGGCL